MQLSEVLESPISKQTDSTYKPLYSYASKLRTAITFYNKLTLINDVIPLCLLFDTPSIYGWSAMKIAGYLKNSFAMVRLEVRRYALELDKVITP